MTRAKIGTTHNYSLRLRLGYIFISIFLFCDFLKIIVLTWTIQND